MAPWHVCGPASLLFGDISSGKDKARMSKQSQPLILSKANLRQQAWLGRPTALTVGLFVWGDNAVKMLWSDSWKDKYLEKGQHTETIDFHLEEYLFPPCSEQMVNEANWQRLEWNRLWEMNLMNGGYRYVARGDRSRFNWRKCGYSSFSCRKDGRSEYSVPRTHTPEYTVTHTDAEQVWSPLYFRLTPDGSDISNHLVCPGLQTVGLHTHLVRLTLCRLPSNPARYTTNLPKMHTLFSNLNFSNVIIPPHYSA